MKKHIGYIDIKSITGNGDIILSEKNFNTLLEENNLPKFRNKDESELAIHRTMFTVFNGRIFFSETDVEIKKHA